MLNNLIDTSSTTLSAGTVIANCVPFVSSYSTSTDGIQVVPRLTSTVMAVRRVYAQRTRTAGAVTSPSTSSNSTLRDPSPAGHVLASSTTSTTETLGTSVDTTRRRWCSTAATASTIGQLHGCRLDRHDEQPVEHAQLQRNATGTSDNQALVCSKALDNQFASGTETARWVDRDLL
jgi:hypothetical protein